MNYHRLNEHETADRAHDLRKHERDEPMNIHEKVALFAAEWERLEGYKPATFQKAIAMQRLERGQSIREIIDALVAQRI
jgi:hypothetical protein